jgi:hypothetical protein
MKFVSLCFFLAEAEFFCDYNCTVQGIFKKSFSTFYFTTLFY